jgi:hypothetical protein
MSTATLPVTRSAPRRVRSELIADTGSYGIDGGINRGCEADVFPLTAQEQTADEIDVNAEASSVAVDQAAILPFDGVVELPALADWLASSMPAPR